MIIVDDPMLDAERERTPDWWGSTYTYRRYHWDEDGTITVTEIPPEDVYLGFRALPRKQDNPPLVWTPTVASVVRTAIRQANGGGDSLVQPGGPPLSSLGPPGDFVKSLSRG